MQLDAQQKSHLSEAKKTNTPESHFTNFSVSQQRDTILFPVFNRTSGALTTEQLHR